MLSLEKFSHYTLYVALTKINEDIIEVKRYSYESINCIYDVDIFSNGLIRYTCNGKDVEKNYIHVKIINNYNLTI